ncbi:hypothetical protein F4780DRAFT_591532 [Xylariomycetidae sp. FL0641]|nr:hypothetical protein F4780DRAFT_591532 [Xylariomycetidae sp. FL0641]
MPCAEADLIRVCCLLRELKRGRVPNTASPCGSLKDLASCATPCLSTQAEPLTLMDLDGVTLIKRKRAFWSLRFGCSFAVLVSSLFHHGMQDRSLSSILMSFSIFPGLEISGLSSVKIVRAEFTLSDHDGLMPSPPDAGWLNRRQCPDSAARYHPQDIMCPCRTGMGALQVALGQGIDGLRFFEGARSMCSVSVMDVCWSLACPSMSIVLG